MRRNVGLLLIIGAMGLVIWGLRQGIGYTVTQAFFAYPNLWIGAFVLGLLGSDLIFGRGGE